MGTSPAVRQREYRKRWKARDLAGFRVHTRKSALLYRERNPEKCRDREYRRRYGISLQEYEALLQQQGGVCASCGAPPNGRRLDVDHDHETGSVRGLLCSGCNLVVGHAKDDGTRLQQVAQYLAAKSRVMR